MTSLDESAPTAADAPTASFTLNGQRVSVRRRHPHLLAALREELDVTSPKDGCSPSGQCGCCTVLIDGKARVACQISLERVDGVLQGALFRFSQGFECGIGLSDFQDLKPGDIIETYEEREVARTLDG